MRRIWRRLSGPRGPLRGETGMASGTILHVNAVGLAASVECERDHGLRGWPFVIANGALPRAVVQDFSPEAHREGVRRGMSLAAARALCPDLRVRPPVPEFCREASDTLWRVAMRYSPLVERAGPGHLFIDLAGTARLFGWPEDAAQKIRLDMLESTGFVPSLALGSNKTVSKVATRVFRPSGFVAPSWNEEQGLVRGQPVQLLPGVGTALLSRLSLLEIDEIGQLADLSPLEARALGPQGPELVGRAGGYDTSPVNPEPPERRLVRGEVFFEPDTADPQRLRIELAALVAELAFSLRKNGTGAHKAMVHLAYTDKVHGMGAATSSGLRVRDDEILSLALTALERARGRRVRIRHLALELSGIDAAGPELDLFEPEVSRLAPLQKALDTVHGRFGLGALVPCSALLRPSTAAQGVAV